MAFRLLKSTQVDVPFMRLNAPFQVDKRKDWGDSPSNIQIAENGAFLKVNVKDLGEVTHMVQPEPDFSAPIGWVPGSRAGVYSKLDIWVDDRVYQPGEKVTLKTRDNPEPMEYDVTAESVVCYNSGPDGKPNVGDAWLQKLKDVKANYKF